ncbi:hypothetical protein ACQZV8_13595 [Magnetococcales bacterium HHB-1]
MGSAHHQLNREKRVPVIEWIGLCGAGKSTWHNALEQHCRSLNHIGENPLTCHDPVRSISPLEMIGRGLFLFIPVLLRHPLHGIRFLSDSAGRRLIIKLGLRSAGIRRQRGGGVRVDSGLLQPLISYECEENVVRNDCLNHLLETLLKSIKPPDIICVLSVSPAQARQRYQQRQHQLKLPAKGSVATFTTASNLLHRILEFYQQRHIKIERCNAISKPTKKDLDRLCHLFMVG